MRAINHALTGAAIGLSVGQPLIAWPTAFASHYLLDSIPHYDHDGDKSDRWVGSPLFNRLLLIDAALCGLLVVLLAVIRPQHWLTAVVAAFLATLPDFMAVGYYRDLKRGRKHTASRYERFARVIQWYEKPNGALVETVWFLGMGYIVFTHLH